MNSLLPARYRHSASPQKSIKGSEEQAAPGHVSRSSSFSIQFHHLPSIFILSGLKRLGRWEGLRDTGLGCPLLSHTSPPTPSFYLCLEEPGHGSPPGVLNAEFDMNISVNIVTCWWVTMAACISLSAGEAASWFRMRSLSMSQSRRQENICLCKYALMHQPQN